MIKNRFIITENDRRNILSMYGLLVEETKTYEIYGIVSDENDKPLTGKIYIFNKEGNRLGGTNTEIDTGKYKIEVRLEPNTKYIIKFIDEINKEYDNDLIVGDQTSVEKNINIAVAKNIEPITAAQNISTNIKLNIDGIKPPFQIIIKPVDTEEILYKQITNEDKLNLNFLNKTGVLVDINDVEKPVGDKYTTQKNTFFNVKQGEEKEISISVLKEDDLILTKNFKIKTGNTAFKFLDGKMIYQYETLEDDNLSDKYIYKITEKVGENKLFIFPNITFSVVDNENKPITGALIYSPLIHSEYETDENGNISILLPPGNNKLLFRKEGYKTLEKEISVKDNDNKETITLTPIVDVTQDITGEPNPKNTLHTLYGKGLSSISYTEAYNNAKFDILDYYVKKHNKKYKDIKIENLKGKEIDLDVKQFYKRPLDKSKEKNYVIVSASKKDVKEFLKNYAEKSNIKIEVEPFEFENLSLSDALVESFYDPKRKQVFALLGLTSNEETANIVNEIQNNADVNKTVTSNYVPIFIPVDRNNSNFNSLQDKLNKIGGSIGNSYPRIFYLTPELNKEGKGEVKEYQMKKTIS